MFKTDRLLIQPLTIDEASFIRELVNTEGWLAFIGDRNVKTAEEALNYTQRLLNNPNVKYWTVITFIQRDYLPHPDIGFAFLPQFGGKGYAYEAANAVLNDWKKQKEFADVLATTIPANLKSIQLLQKLGLHFQEEIEIDNKTLHIYSLLG